MPSEMILPGKTDINTKLISRNISMIENLNQGLGYEGKSPSINKNQTQRLAYMRGITCCPIN